MPATPCWAATRSLLARSWPTLPTRCAPMAAALTGVHRSQPALATRPVAESLPASPAAAFSATALASVPPNQAERPRSCRVRDRVLRAMTSSLQREGRSPHYPRRSGVMPVARNLNPASGAVAQGRPLPGLGRLDLAVLGRRRRHQGVEQPRGGRRDLGDGAVEGLAVGQGRFRRPADLAHVLEGRGLDLVVGRRRLEVGERADVPAHARSVSPPAGSRPRLGYRPEPAKGGEDGVLSEWRGAGGPFRSRRGRPCG